MTQLPRETEKDGDTQTNQRNTNEYTKSLYEFTGRQTERDPTGGTNRCADPRYHAFEVLYCARYHGVGRGRATGAASPRLGRSMPIMHAMELRT